MSNLRARNGVKVTVSRVVMLATLLLVLAWGAPAGATLAGDTVTIRRYVPTQTALSYGPLSVTVAAGTADLVILDPFLETVRSLSLPTPRGYGVNLDNERVRARDWMMPMLRQRLAARSAAELGAVFERHGLPYAPITRPQDLFEDPHLSATGGLATVTIPASASGAGRTVQARTPRLPLALDGARLPARRGPPALGQDTVEVLRELGYRDREIAELQGAGIVANAGDGAAGATEAASG